MQRAVSIGWSAEVSFIRGRVRPVGGIVGCDGFWVSVGAEKWWRRVSAQDSGVRGHFAPWAFQKLWISVRSQVIVAIGSAGWISFFM